DRPRRTRRRPRRPDVLPRAPDAAQGGPDARRPARHRRARGADVPVRNRTPAPGRPPGELPALVEALRLHLRGGPRRTPSAPGDLPSAPPRRLPQRSDALSPDLRSDRTLPRSPGAALAAFDVARIRPIDGSARRSSRPPVRRSSRAEAGAGPPSAGVGAG